jgi:hypothetical protein
MDVIGKRVIARKRKAPERFLDLKDFLEAIFRFDADEYSHFILLTASKYGGSLI